MPPVSQSPTGNTSPGSILLIEEHDALAVAITSALRKFAPGHSVHVARSLTEAKTLAKTVEPELLIIDFDPPFPGLSAFLQKMQKNRSDACALIIAGKLPSKVMTATRSGGALQFVEKPFDVQDFGAAVQASLGPWRESETSTSHGTLQDLALADLLIAQCAGARTVALEVTNGHGKSGEIHLRQGTPGHAEAGRKSGEDALREMLTWREPEVRERERPRSTRNTIQSDWPDVVVETYRRAKPKPRKATPKAAPKSVPPEAPATPQWKLVVIDDTEMLLVFVEDVLATSGREFHITTAPNGLKGLKEIERTKPDLVLLDYSLPDINGDEVCRRLLQKEATARIPILMMSGHVIEMSKAAATLDNVVATIEKPFRSEALVDLVQQVLTEQRPVRKKAAAARKPAPAPAPPSSVKSAERPAVSKKEPEKIPSIPEPSAPPLKQEVTPTPPEPATAPTEHAPAIHPHPLAPPEQQAFPFAPEIEPPPAPVRPEPAPPVVPPSVETVRTPAPPPPQPPVQPSIEPVVAKAESIVRPEPAPSVVTPSVETPSAPPLKPPVEPVAAKAEPVTPTQSVVDKARRAIEQLRRQIAPKGDRKHASPLPPPRPPVRPPSPKPPPQPVAPGPSATAVTPPPSPTTEPSVPKTPTPSPTPRIRPAVFPTPAQVRQESPPPPQPPEQIVSTRVLSEGPNEVVLSLFLDVLSVQLTPELRMGSIRAKPSSGEVSLHVVGPAMRGKIPQNGFKLGEVGLDAKGRIKTMRLIPTQIPFKPAPTQNSLQIGAVSVVPIDSTSRMQLTPAPQAPMTLRLLAHLELAGVELSPTFEISQIVLKDRGQPIRVTMNSQTGAEENGTACETVGVRLDHFAHIAELLLNPVR